MSDPLEILSILGPAFVAGILVTAVLVPFGFEVLKRGIVFIDLAVAQIAGLGVIFADFLGWEPLGVAVQVSALGAALGTALLLTWTERRWPEVQEAIIGVVFVLGASAAILLLASNPHGGEHLKDLLVGQILWVNSTRLPLQALIYAAILSLWFGLGARLGRAGFYVLFACAVTFRCNWSGFTPFSRPWCCRPWRRTMRCGGARQKPTRSACGHALGLLASLWLDLASGAMIVCAMALVAVLAAGFERRPAT